MRSYRSKRLAIIIGAVCAITAGVWLLVVAKDEGTPLRPWQPLWTTTAKPAPPTAPNPEAVVAMPQEPSSPTAVAAVAPPPAAPQVVQAVEPSVEAAEPASTAEEPPVAAPTSSSLAQSQTEGTHRMFMAHTSLRLPEVSDPDSTANKAILTTMVLKSLAHSKAEQASPNAAK